MVLSLGGDSPKRSIPLNRRRSSSSGSQSSKARTGRSAPRSKSHGSALAVGCAAAATQALAADLFSQSVLEGKGVAAVNARRSACFAGFGLLYSGGFAHTLYNKFLPWLLRLGAVTSPGLRVLSSVAMDNILFTPFLYLPSFYLLKEVLVKGGTAEAAGAKYARDLPAIWAQTAKFYVPMHFVTFGLVPPHLRVVFANLIGGVYMVMLTASTSTATTAATTTDAAASPAPPVVAVAGAEVLPAAAVVPEPMGILSASDLAALL